MIHPRNPMVPTIHFNYRYFEVKDKDGKPGRMINIIYVHTKRKYLYKRTAISLALSSNRPRHGRWKRDAVDCLLKTNIEKYNNNKIVLIQEKFFRYRTSNAIPFVVNAALAIPTSRSSLHYNFKRLNLNFSIMLNTKST